MKIFIKAIRMMLVTSILLVTTNCELFDLDINQDPNNPTTADPNLLLTNSERSLFTTFVGVSNNLQGFMAILTSADNFGLSNPSYNGTWGGLYSGPLKDLELLIKSTEGTSPRYNGIAKTLWVYAFSTLVDLFGDVPYSDAFQGVDNLAPSFEGGQQIYSKLFVLLDEANESLKLVSPVAVSGDVIFNNNAVAWRKFNRSLKLEMLLKTRLRNTNAKSDIEALLAATGTDPLITATSEDAQFRFSRLVTPNFRHPWYNDSYAGTNNFGYISGPFMLDMIADKDPRHNFYFRRQSSVILDIENPSERNTMPCSQTPGCTYGYFPLSDVVAQRVYGVNAAALTTTQKRWLAGFFGRERADPAGIPLDGGFRAMPGVYPAGGFYDPGNKDAPSTSTFASATSNAHTAPGGGIFPIITSVDVRILQIEAILVLGINGQNAANARALFNTAMRDHIAKVAAFGAATDPASLAPAAVDIDNYVNLWLAKYDNATANVDKLDVVLQQYRYMGYGQGFHSYNAYRRTGYPSNLQIGIQYNRNFALRLPYPQQEITLNPNAKDFINVVFDVTPIWWGDKLPTFPKVGG